MLLKNYTYSGLLPEMMPVRDQAYRPIRDTVAMKKGGLVPKGKHRMPDGTIMLDSAHKKKHSAKPHGKKGSAEMKAHMAKLRKMKK